MRIRNRSRVLFPEKSIIQDLYVRFIVFLPHEEYHNTNRLMFHIQAAHWFFIDNMAGTLTLEQFVCEMIPFLRNPKWQYWNVKSIIRSFWQYNADIPRAGGVLINDQKNKVLLVRSCGGSRWGFPVGKVNYQESTKDCAQREVFEETGFHGRASELCFSYQKNKAIHTLYLFPNTPENYGFSAQTTNEIDEIKWVEIAQLDKLVGPTVQKNVYSLINQLQFSFYFKMSNNASNELAETAMSMSLLGV